MQDSLLYLEQSFPPPCGALLLPPPPPNHFLTFSSVYPRQATNALEINKNPVVSPGVQSRHPDRRQVHPPRCGFLASVSLPSPYTFLSLFPTNFFSDQRPSPSFFIEASVPLYSAWASLRSREAFWYSFLRTTNPAP